MNYSTQDIYIINDIEVDDMLKRQRLLQMRYPDWIVTQTRGGHLKLKHSKSRRVVFASMTPGDWRSDKNLESKLRRERAP